MPNDTPDSPTEPVAEEAALLEQFVDLDALTESQWRALVAGSLSAGRDRMDVMSSQIKDNTDITREIRDVVLLARSFFSGLGKFASGCARIWTVLQPVVKACTVIATAYAAIRGAVYVATHGAPPPTK